MGDGGGGAGICSLRIFEKIKQTQKSQNCWVFGLFSIVWYSRETTFRKLDLFPSSGEGGGEDTY
jgi:hypothetical protein